MLRSSLRLFQLHSHLCVIRNGGDDISAVLVVPDFPDVHEGILIHALDLERRALIRLDRPLPGHGQDVLHRVVGGQFIDRLCRVRLVFGHSKAVTGSAVDHDLIQAPGHLDRPRPVGLRIERDRLAHRFTGPRVHQMDGHRRGHDLGVLHGVIFAGIVPAHGQRDL